MLIFIFGTIFSSAVVGAADNPLVNETASKILEANNSVNQSVNNSTNQSASQFVPTNETYPTNTSGGAKTEENSSNSTPGFGGLIAVTGLLGIYVAKKK